MTGSNPVDRAKPGAKLHVLADRSGVPLVTGISAANTTDGFALKPLVNAIPAIRSRRGPRRRKLAKLDGDKAYNSAERRFGCRDEGSSPRPHRHRPQQETRQASLGDRTLHRLADRIPATDHPPTNAALTRSKDSSFRRRADLLKKLKQAN